MSTYINLRTYSDYSIGKSVIKIQDLTEHCLKKHIPAVGIADYNNLFGSLEFSLECQKRGVQPIIGSVLTVSYDNQNKEKQKYADILLIAKTRVGYENLMKLVSNCYLHHPDPSSPPHILINELLEKSDDLILLCGSNNSPLEQLFSAGKEDLANDFVSLLLTKFKDNLFLELSRTEDNHNYGFDKFLTTIALEKSIPIVATNPTQYIDQSMQDALDALICITEGRYLVEDNRNKAGNENYFKSMREMKKLFADIPEAIQNTELIAKKCSFLLKESKPLIPKLLKSKKAEAQELSQQATEGLKRRLQDYDEEEQKQYFERLEFELSVINKMNFGSYFLIVADFIKWSKEQDIPVGPGRGSGAGSVVAWSLEISGIDPIKFGLLFERFLNPDRVSMPDFDIDFCQDRRDEVIEYVKQKFGSNKVAHIITFGKLQARAVLRDVGRVLQIPYMQVDKICKMVPNNPANPITLKEAIDMDKELKKQGKSDSNVEKLMSISLKLEGVNRHISTHAAGIVIADKELTKVVALYKAADSDMPIVQYSLKYAEKIGLVKFDFLGLKTLTVISWACKLIQQTGVNLDISKIALDDKKTYEMLSHGDCIGVFQFESSGMREAIKKIKPDRIDDLVALGSLYRPGPMDNIPSYISRKHGKEEIDYIHPLLEPVLKETYGIIVYQEQVMQIAQILAGYTLAEADLLRRAMGKKIKAEMEAQRSKFIDGCIANNLDKDKAEEIFNLVNKFASYGFNKSHAVAYAYIAYQTAYLKANFPLEFLTASINLEIDNTDKIYLFLMEAKKFKIETLLPDVNNSKAEFIIEDGKIRFGLAGLKGVGKKIVDLIVEEREIGGQFKDIFDFFERVSDIGINKKVFENLTKSGAFDSLKVNRNSLLMNAELLLKHSNMSNKNENQLSLFFDVAEDTAYRQQLEMFEEWDEKQMMKAEFESFGYYLSVHPLEKYQSIIKELDIIESCDIDKIEDSLSKVNLTGVLLSKKVRSTARGKYAFLQISDLKGIIDLAIFNEDLLLKMNDILEEGNTLYFKSEIRRDSAGLRIIAWDVKTIEQAVLESEIYVAITIKNKKQLGFIKDKTNYKQGVKVQLMLKLEGGDIVTFKHDPQILVDLNELEVLKKGGIKMQILHYSL